MLPPLRRSSTVTPSHAPNTSQEQDGKDQHAAASWVVGGSSRREVSVIENQPQSARPSRNVASAESLHQVITLGRLAWKTAQALIGRMDRKVCSWKDGHMRSTLPDSLMFAAESILGGVRPHGLARSSHAPSGTPRMKSKFALTRDDPTHSHQRTCFPLIHRNLV